MTNPTSKLNPFSFDSLYQETEYSYNNDPLILSCSLKDLIDKGIGYRDFESQEVLDNISSDTKLRAEEIRKYYGKKYLWQRLNGKTLSGYRDRTLFLLENRTRTKLKDMDKGIYFKLPYFYEEDIIYDEFKKKYNTEKISPLGNKKSNVFSKLLTFIQTSTGNQSKRKIKYFWFHDDNNDLYSIHVRTNNELLPMFESAIASKKEHVFETRLSEKRIDNMFFYKLHSFKFLKV